VDSPATHNAPLATHIPADVGEALAIAGDRLGPFQRQLAWYAQLASTNDAAMAMAAGGAAEGRVIAANAQSSGRGRHGRSWASPPGAGLYVSVILRPRPVVLPLLTIAAGVAIAEGVEAATGIGADVKWPNDVYVGARKLGGILAEAGSTGAGGACAVAYVVLGFGINLLTASYPPDVAARATSVEHELGRAPDRGLVLAECLAALASRYAALSRGRGSEVTAAWRARAARHMGRAVEWDVNGATRTGVAHDIDDGGALLVRAGGDTVRIISGEVRWI
jgi:BirA family biotin operon repressor/biotin-[acetyl-CoA-carboxylase] ligase